MTMGERVITSRFPKPESFMVLNRSKTKDKTYICIGGDRLPAALTSLCIDIISKVGQIPIQTIVLIIYPVKYSSPLKPTKLKNKL